VNFIIEQVKLKFSNILFSTGYLKRLLGRCPHLVRVYSELIERKDFPLPVEPLPPRRRTNGVESPVCSENRDVALHYMIRQPEKPFASKLAEFDQRFRNEPENVSEKEVTEYLDLVTMCEIEELKRADIVLCTCTVSSGPKLRKIQEERTCCFNQVSAVEIIMSDRNDFLNLLSFDCPILSVDIQWNYHYWTPLPGGHLY
jgi:hypothetical protein